MNYNKVYPRVVMIGLNVVVYTVGCSITPKRWQVT